MNETAEADLVATGRFTPDQAAQFVEAITPHELEPEHREAAGRLAESA
jgi:hypothetical protein